MEDCAGVSPPLLPPSTPLVLARSSVAGQPWRVGLRWVWGALALALLAVGCGGSAAGPVAVNPAMQPLPPPADGDPAAEGAPYLAMLASRLAPEWRHFLDDCRLRLPAEHPLNDLRLEATASAVVDRAGAISSVELTSSGNGDFDGAVREVMSAVGPLPPPPAWLLSDDDKLRLTWRFARDQRQAGAAGASVQWLEEPAPQVVDRRLAAGDIEGAARRVARLPEADPALREQARRVLLAAVVEGFAGQGQVQREAVMAVRRAGLRELAPLLVPLSQAAEPGLREQAAAALAELAAPATAPVLLELLAAAREPALAAALARALATIGMAPAAEAAVIRLSGGDRAAQLAAMSALAELPVSTALAAQITRWSTSRDPLLRGALCTAVARAKVQATVRWDLLGRGMGDRDGSARAACTAALALLTAKPLPWMRFALQRSIEDRDQRVRAAALTSMLRWDPARLRDRLRALAADGDAQVRAATVPGLASHGDLATLRGLLSDTDVQVRRTAAQALVLVEEAAVREVAMRDPDARVRLVALEGRADPSAVLKVLANDEVAEVRTEVEVLRVAHRGESLQSGLLRMAGTGGSTVERVRISLAWLLAT
ncbi:MAG: HEAT repeat domain-containing protein [Myxococcales bacterium]|nr:HEAT repeat domain-containing protein [Myxococcales bacterium]